MLEERQACLPLIFGLWGWGHPINQRRCLLCGIDAGLGQGGGEPVLGEGFNVVGVFLPAPLH